MDKKEVWELLDKINGMLGVLIDEEDEKTKEKVVEFLDKEICLIEYLNEMEKRIHLEKGLKDLILVGRMW
ncbi:hypothetical protein KAW48_02730 [candidate division WOR-3 bacterium]|nr:hypothetical protein [candidate division WOR-3 bacterium]